MIISGKNSFFQIKKYFFKPKILYNICLFMRINLPVEPNKMYLAQIYIFFCTEYFNKRLKYV